MSAMDAVRKLILEKADERGTTLAELSRKLERNHAYLQQFIHRGVPADLPEKVRLPLALALNIDEEQLKPDALKVPKNGTLNHTQPPHESVAIVQRRSAVLEALPSDPSIKPGSELVGRADLPVFGTAQGGKGALIVSERAVDWVVRPDPLLRVADGYGIIVTGDSMSPVHKSGSIALVNPHQPWRAGDTCVFRSHADDGTVQIIIKELRRFTDTTWHVRQYNPKKDFSLKRDEWQVCHVTVGNYFAR